MMGSNTCPLCGEGEIVFFNTVSGPDYDAWYGCTDCRLVFDVDHDERFTAAMDAERRLVELQEAVRWERECEAVRNQLRPFRNWPELAESVDSYQAARAEVDRLIAEGEG